MAEKADEHPAPTYSNSVMDEMKKAASRASPSDGEEKAVQKPIQNAPEQAKPDEKKPSKLKQLWDKTGLDAMTLKLMFKGSLPPVIALSMYQATGVAEVYQTLGYLVAISSILGFCIMPRGKFIQTMTLNIFAICLASATNILALYCVVKAREHTTPPGHPLKGYNASASAVCAVWLIFQIFIVNSVRAARPQFQFPAILCTIFIVVSMTYGTQFPTVPSILSFMRRLLLAFLTGFGLATAVSFLIFPMSSRMVLFKEMAGYMNLMNGVLKAQVGYMASLENFDPQKAREERDAQEAKDAQDPKKPRKKKDAHKPAIMETPALLKLKALLDKLVELHVKLSGDVTPAKREFAIGKLQSHDLTELARLMRFVFLPVVGLVSMINLFERRAEEQHWAYQGVTAAEEEKRHWQLDNLHYLLKQLHEPFQRMTGVLDGGFKHVLITLELVKPDKKKEADEESADPHAPGTPGFAEEYKKKVDNFYNSKETTLKEWCASNGIELPPDFFDSSFVLPEKIEIANEQIRERHQRQLFFTLFLEYLLWRVSTSLLDLVVYVDRRKQEGAFKSNKLIFVGSKTLYRWFKSTLGREDATADSYDHVYENGTVTSVYPGSGFVPKRDPEREPPRNAREKFGEKLRIIPTFFRSESSAFGFRVCAATMTIGIVCYLRDTQYWFLRNRLLWAMIMTAMSMSRTAGQSIFQFVLRVLGTTIAMVGSYIIWYIVDGKTPGVLVFLWLWMPKFIIVAILSLVTAVLIIGYELQVRVIGEKAATMNGQPAYPTYELAPYRLATVAGGIFIAFIWTIFPFPISESTELRKDISAALYLLSAYYSLIHETIKLRIDQTGGDPKVKGTHAHRLEKARSKAFLKLVAIIGNLQTNVAFSKFQLSVGGRFPREEYEELIGCIRRLVLSISLASFSSMTFDTNGATATKELTEWSNDFRKMMLSVDTTSNRITSLLSMLSSSLSNAQPLPPFLELPHRYKFIKEVESIDRDILSVRHIAEPEYSAFAVMQVVSESISNDVGLLLKHVRNLVGEIDFSSHAVESTSSSSDSLAESVDDKGKMA